MTLERSLEHVQFPVAVDLSELALGHERYQVRRGEKRTPVTTWITITRVDEKGDPVTVRQAKRTVLFCRHQVAQAE